MLSSCLNDIPIEDLSLVVEEAQPIMARVALQRDRQAWPGRVGPLMSPLSTADSTVRRYKWTGKAATPAARNAVMETLLDVLTGVVELRDRDTPTRVTRGTVRVFDPSVLSPSFVNVEPSIVVEFETNGAAYEASSVSLVLSTTPVAIPCGTLPHGGRIYLTGTAAGAISTEVRIRYRGISGALLGEMVILPSLASGEHGVIDLDSQEILKVSTANATTNVDAWLTGGNFFKLARRDGNPALSAWPTMEVTAGAALYTYRKNWKA
jgi:hypothetical protein